MERFRDKDRGDGNNGRQALERILRSNPDIVLTDIRMPGLNGLDLIRTLKGKGCKAKCIIVSGYSEFEYAKEAIELEAVDYLVKPAELGEVAKTVSRAIQRLERKSEQSGNRPELRFARALNQVVFTDLIVHGTSRSFDQTPYERYNQFAAILIGSPSAVWVERMKNNNVTDALLSFLADRGIVVELLYEQQKIILLCMTSLEDCAVLTDILMAEAAAFSGDSSPDGIALSVGIGEVVTGVMQAHLSFLLAEQACQMALFFGMPVMEADRWTEICHVSGRWLSDWSDQVNSCVRYVYKEFEELLGSLVEWGAGRLIASASLKKAGIQ
ncbi:response regulator [Paenibacillus sp. FSL L8-0708]|uniref:response regulator n=1 Tax=Paenibacillus sp. FSL L8-0708 TaxID=2975311 RepID=UPI0030FABD0B